MHCSKEQEIRDNNLIKRNIKLLNSGVSSIQYRLQHLSLSQRYCDKFSADIKKSCDCVNLRVSQLLSDLFPASGQMGNSKNSKKIQFKTPTSSGGGLCKIDEILQSLTSENEALWNHINEYEKKIRSVENEILM